ncbi:MAG TPA: TrkA family potassium uptake protein [Candidatus Dormibacteraeota bacterium]|jgi:trk system potassium uptake protein TrkA|nr:TrkA family potassium uptake protein [Candidatus Dormibacteraeota bacterium]
MKVLIVGCGRVGGLLAGRLDAEGHEVTIIDENRAQFEKNLPQSFNGATVLGSGIDMDVLRGAGIAEVEAFVIVTQGDNRNIMGAQIAKEIFGVRRVLCKINDPIRAQTYRGHGIETWSRTTILSEIIHDLLTGREKESGTLLDRARRREAILAGDVVPES